MGATPGCCTTSDRTAIDVPAGKVLMFPASSIRTPLRSMSGSSADIVNASRRPFDGAKAAQRVESEEHPRLHAVAVADIPSVLQMERVPSIQVVAPGVHPQRSGGQSVGVVVHTCVSPPDGAYSPFTSQNGYGAEQSESLSH